MGVTVRRPSGWLGLGVALVFLGAVQASAGPPAPEAATPTPPSPDRSSTAEAPFTGTSVTGASIAETPAPEDRRLLVTLAKAPPKELEATVEALRREYRLRKLTAWDLQSLGIRCVVFELRRRQDPAEVLARLAEDDRVEIAQRVVRFEAQGTAVAEPADAVPSPDAVSDAGDPYQKLQHGLEGIRLGGAHHLAMGSGVRVAVVDTAIDTDHPDFEGRVVLERNYGPEEHRAGKIHGTAVAGVIAAGSNGLGILGVAPKVEVLALAACWSEEPTDRSAICDSLTLARALDAAIRYEADIVNLSLAGPPDPLVRQLIGAAIERGMVVVASDDGRGRFPASLEGVLAVGSDQAQANATVRAPGVDILSTVPGGGYDFFSGASLAAAQVTGVCALLRELDDSLDTAAMARLLAPAAAEGLDACGAVARTASPTADPASSGSTALASDSGSTGRLEDLCGKTRVATAP